MPVPDDPKTQETLDALLQSNGFTAETRFYRYTLPEFLSPGAEADALRLSANADSPEALVDIYRSGHVVVAEQIGPGLALAQERDNQWLSPERKLVEVRLGDVLAQGGLVYPVESVVTEKTWFMTLPQGEVPVREVP
jgi:hypothetical protein